MWWLELGNKEDSDSVGILFKTISSLYRVILFYFEIWLFALFNESGHAITFNSVFKLLHIIMKHKGCKNK